MADKADVVAFMSVRRLGRRPGDLVEVPPDAVAHVPPDALAVVTTTWTLSQFPLERRLRLLHRRA